MVSIGDSIMQPDKGQLSAADISRIIEMAWADEIPFEGIKAAYGLSESAVIALMRQEMKASSFRMWRKRVTGRQSKHKALGQQKASDRRGKIPGDIPSDMPP